jgi:predicted transcriptional regulator
MALNSEGPVPGESAVHRRVRARGEEVRGFILANIERNPGDIARLVTEQFDINRQAANKHLKNLVAEGALLAEGRTQYRSINSQHFMAEIYQSVLNSRRIWSGRAVFPHRSEISRGT